MQTTHLAFLGET